MSRSKRVSLPGRFIETVEREQLLPEKSRVLIAVSGGADSVCLLELLLVVAPRYGLELYGFHLNHRLRVSAEMDESFVRQRFELAKLPLVVVRSDVRGYARRHRLGIEEAGRELRYQHLERHAVRLGCGRVALGHTADDNLETLLLNLARGTGVSGLRGIPVRRGIFVRPLIDLTRSDIERWLSARGVVWREDESNQDESYSRNLLRLRVVPVLRGLNPEIASAGRRTARLVTEEDDFLEELTQNAFERVVRLIESGVEIDLGALSEYNLCLKRRIVRKLVPGLDSSRVECLLAFLEGSSQMFEPLAGWRFVRRADGCVIMHINKKGIHGR